MNEPRWNELFSIMEEIKKDAGDGAETMDILLSSAQLLLEAREEISRLEDLLGVDREKSYGRKNKKQDQTQALQS